MKAIDGLVESAAVTVFLFWHGMNEQVISNLLEALEIFRMSAMLNTRSMFDWRTVKMLEGSILRPLALNELAGVSLKMSMFELSE